MLEYKLTKLALKNILISVLSNIVVNMIVIFITTRIFNNIFVENIIYLFIVSLLLLFLNKSVKPILSIVMLPLNFITLGITYPLVNVIILKLASLLLGRHFVVSGWFSIFFMSIFISIMTFIIDRLVGKEIRRV